MRYASLNSVRTERVCGVDKTHTRIHTEACDKVRAEQLTSRKSENRRKRDVVF